MDSDGNTAAEGIYVRKGDMRAMCFDDDFMYVFYFSEGIGFQFAKEKSNPIPGYEFEDGKLFALDENVLIPIEG